MARTSKKTRPSDLVTLPADWQGWHITADTLTDPDGNCYRRDDLRAVWLAWQQLSAYRQQAGQLRIMIAALMAAQPRCSRPWQRRSGSTSAPVQLSLIPDTRPQKTRP